MTFVKQITAFLLLSIIGLTGCKPEDPNFRYVKLEEFRYSEATIKEGTKIKILSFSGGKDCSPEETYYFQFIGVNQSTMDTVRILSPCQLIKADEMPEEGNFYPLQESAALLEKVLKEHGEKPLIAEKKFVVFNRHFKDIEERNFKTAIGMLSFK